MMRLRLLAILVAVCTVMAFGSLADVATAAFVIENHSFESPDTTGWYHGMPSYWSGENGQGGLIDGPSYCPPGYTDTQTFVIDSRSVGHGGGPTDIWQNVGMGTSVENPNVKLEVDVAFRTDSSAPASYTIALWWDSDADGSPDTELASATDPVTPNNTAFQMTSVTAYNVAVDMEVFVRLLSAEDTAGVPFQTLIDNIRVTAVTGGTPPDPIPGDANRDDVVDDKDASILAAHWQTGPGANWGDGDFNEDGFVNDEDASILAAHWLETREGTVVPEPTTVAMLLGGLLSLWIWRRR